LADDAAAVRAAKAAGDEDAYQAAVEQLVAHRNEMKAELHELKEDLRSVTDQARAAIRAALRDTVTAYKRGQYFEVPMPAIVATAAKP
jgi:cell division protein FtsB